MARTPTPTFPLPKYIVRHRPDLGRPQPGAPGTRPLRFDEHPGRFCHQHINLSNYRERLMSIDNLADHALALQIGPAAAPPAAPAAPAAAPAWTRGAPLSEVRFRGTAHARASLPVRLHFGSARWEKLDVPPTAELPQIRYDEAPSANGIAKGLYTTDFRDKIIVVSAHRNENISPVTPSPWERIAIAVVDLWSFYRNMNVLRDVITGGKLLPPEVVIYLPSVPSDSLSFPLFRDGLSLPPENVLAYIYGPPPDHLAGFGITTEGQFGEIWTR